MSRVFAGQLVTKIQCSSCRQTRDRTEIVSDIGFAVATPEELKRAAKRHGGKRGV